MIDQIAQKKSQPLLSIVATARNDNHGGNLIGRMQIFVNGVLEQCERHDIDAELILVDWNPPGDKPHLSEALTWPASPGKCSVRVIEVPHEVHTRMKHSSLPLFQMIAKNVGIRRARGQYVLATNIDILFSDPVFQFMKSDQLRPGYMYRVNRFDVPENVPGDCSLDEQLQFCQENIIRKHFFEGSFDCRTRKWSSWRENVQTRRGRFWNFFRRIRHRIKVHSRTMRNELVNRAIYSRNVVRLYYRRYSNHIRNYGGHYYRRSRGHVRHLLNRCGHTYRVNRNHVRNYVGHYYRNLKGYVRTFYNRCGHTYRTYRNYARNYFRHKYNTTVKNTVRTIKFRLGTLRRWIHPTKGPGSWKFWLYLLLIPFRIVLLILSIPFRLARAGLWQLNRMIARMIGADRVQTTYDRLWTNNFFNSINVPWAHYRERMRLKYRYFAMTGRDRLPRWLDESGMLPPRANTPGRDERIRNLERRIERMQSAPVGKYVPRVTAYQLWQCELRRIARARLRRMREIAEIRYKIQLRRDRARERLRALDYKIERQRRAGWVQWGKQKRKELKIQDRLLRKELKAQRKNEHLQQRLEQQRQREEERIERELQQQLGLTQVSEQGELAVSDQASPDDLPLGSQAELGNVLHAAEQLECEALPAVALCDSNDSCDSGPPSAAHVPASGEFRRNGHASLTTEAGEVDHSHASNGQRDPQLEPSAEALAAEGPATFAPDRTSLEDSLEAGEMTHAAAIAVMQRKEKLRLAWPYLHTNGCGDFTMLAKEDWAALGGYAEFEMYSMHIDSLFLVAGSHRGLKQFVLGARAPIYHIEHGIGSGWTPEGEEKLKQRLREAKIPQLSHDEFMDYDVTMARSGKAEMFNGPNWGLADIDLPDIDII